MAAGSRAAAARAAAEAAARAAASSAAARATARASARFCSSTRPCSMRRWYAGLRLENPAQAAAGEPPLCCSRTPPSASDQMSAALGWPAWPESSEDELPTSPSCKPPRAARRVPQAIRPPRRDLRLSRRRELALSRRDLGLTRRDLAVPPQADCSRRGLEALSWRTDCCSSTPAALGHPPWPTAHRDWADARLMRLKESKRHTHSWRWWLGWYYFHCEFVTL